MTTDQLLTVLKERGLTLTVVDGKMRISGNLAELTPALRDVLEIHKPKIVGNNNGNNQRCPRCKGELRKNACWNKACDWDRACKRCGENTGTPFQWYCTPCDFAVNHSAAAVATAGGETGGSEGAASGDNRSDSAS